jgi:hypothetical protein
VFSLEISPRCDILWPNEKSYCSKIKIYCSSTVASSTKFRKESKKEKKRKRFKKKEKSDQKELSKSARDIQVLEGSIKVVIF